MRTSEEIDHRVRWDPRFDPARFVLGVNVRGAEPKRVPLPAFVPGGDIPWHRVLFVEADGEVIWDRATGVECDRLRRPAGRVRTARLLRAPFFTASYAARVGPGSPAGRPAPVRPHRRRHGLTCACSPGTRCGTGTTATASTPPAGARCSWPRSSAPTPTSSPSRRSRDGLLAALLAAPWVRERNKVGHRTGRAGHREQRAGAVEPVAGAGVRPPPVGPPQGRRAITVDTATGPVVVVNTPT